MKKPTYQLNMTHSQKSSRSKYLGIQPKWQMAKKQVKYSLLQQISIFKLSLDSLVDFSLLRYGTTIFIIVFRNKNCEVKQGIQFQRSNGCGYCLN